MRSVRTSLFILVGCALAGQAQINLGDIIRRRPPIPVRPGQKQFQQKQLFLKKQQEEKLSAQKQADAKARLARLRASNAQNGSGGPLASRPSPSAASNVTGLVGSGIGSGGGSGSTLSSKKQFNAASGAHPPGNATPQQRSTGGNGKPDTPQTNGVKMPDGLRIGPHPQNSTHTRPQ
jgi:hypothetical protein